MPNVFDQFDEQPKNVFDQFDEPQPQPHGAGGSFENDDMAWRDVLSNAIKNIPSSAYQTGSNLVQPFIHPIKTGKALGKVAVGGVEKLVPGQQDYEQNFDAMVDFFKNRYGDLDKFKRTLAEDPVGVLVDAASVAIPGGAAVKGVGTAGKIESIARAGALTSKVGAAMEPLNIIKQVASLPIKAIPKGFPIRLYKSAAKFSTVLTDVQRQRLASTAVNEGIMPTVNGLNNLKNKINDLNDTVSAMVDNSVSTGQTIPIDSLFSKLDDLRHEVLATSGTPIDGIKAIDKVENEIKTANIALQRKALTPLEAQKMKQKLYRENQSAYESMMHHPASAQAKMAIAQSAKEALEAIIPEIKQLNSKEGALIDLQKHIERAAARITNRDIMGIGIPIKGGVGGIVGGYKGATAAIALGLLDTPVIKAKLAIVLNKLRQKGMKVTPSMAMARLIGIQSGQAENVTQ